MLDDKGGEASGLKSQIYAVWAAVCVAISINNGFFPDQGVRNYEFIPIGITSIGGLELEI
jgi:hypothetical protein